MGAVEDMEDSDWYRMSKGGHHKSCTSHFSACRSATPHPTVMWAQRPKLVFLTICLSDCQKPEIKVEKDKLSFRGVGGTDNKEHACDIEFLKEIDPDVSIP